MYSNEEIDLLVGLAEKLPHPANKQASENVIDILHTRHECEMLGIDYTNPGPEGYRRALAYGTHMLTDQGMLNEDMIPDGVKTRLPTA